MPWSMKCPALSTGIECCGTAGHDREQGWLDFLGTHDG